MRLILLCKGRSKGDPLDLYPGTSSSTAAVASSQPTARLRRYTQMGRARRAERAYAAFEPVLVAPAPLWARGAEWTSQGHPSGGGMVEHRINAAELRNEAAFINDFRDDVGDLDAPSRRSANVTATTCIVEGSVHAVVSTTVPVAAGRELLLDYGEDYWRGAQQQQQQEAAARAPPPPPPSPEPGAPTGGAGARRRRDAALRELEQHQPMDRESVHLQASAANDDGYAGWEWLECSSRAWQQVVGTELIEGVDISAAVLPERFHTEGTQVHIDFPGVVYQHTTTVQRRALLRAIQDWVKRGASADLVQVGRLLNPGHPAAATSASGSAFGLFALEDLPAGTVVCEYQGVRYTSAAGIDPFHPSQRRRDGASCGGISMDYMLSLATVVGGRSRGEIAPDAPLASSRGPANGGLEGEEEAAAAWLRLVKDEDEEDEHEDGDDDNEEMLRVMEQEVARRERWLTQLTAFAEAAETVQSEIYLAAATSTREGRAAKFAAQASEGRAVADYTERERVAYIWCVKHDTLAHVPACVRDLSTEVAQTVLALFDQRGMYSSSGVAGTGTDAGTCMDMLLAPDGLRHSCDPNLLLLPPEADTGAGAVFVATRDIAEGEKLTVHIGGHRSLPTPLPPAHTAAARRRRGGHGHALCVCEQCRAEERLRAVVCPTCVPPSDRRAGYILPIEVISASVEEDQQQTGYVVPQWQQPLSHGGGFRSTRHVRSGGGSSSSGSSSGSSDDEGEEGGAHHCAGWACNHFQEHFVPRRGGGSHEQKRWDHHRGVMQRRWLPSHEVDCCRPASASATPSVGPLKGILAVEMIALKLLWAMHDDLDRVTLDRDIALNCGTGSHNGGGADWEPVEGEEDVRAACCKRANAVASVVGRQHWMTNHALALLVSRCNLAESSGLFNLYCWMTIWLGRSAATAAAHLLPLCSSPAAAAALAAILDAEAPDVRRGLVDCGLLPPEPEGPPPPPPPPGDHSGYGSADMPAPVAAQAPPALQDGQGDERTSSDTTGSSDDGSVGAGGSSDYAAHTEDEDLDRLD
eukprot:COSAG06_NODE_226_length_19747_cov_9.234121_14_plen_1035_part_00